MDFRPPTYSRAAGESVAGTPYHITATLSATGELNNYNITNNGAVFTINRRNATWTTNPNSKTYGDADPSPLTTGSGNNFIAADNITNNGAAFTINRRNATWTTNPNSKTYGDADPSPLTTGSGNNFIAADNVNATYSRAAGESVAGSPYHIT